MSHRARLLTLVLATTALASAALAPAGASTTWSRAAVDFDGDGAGDVAIAFDYAKRDDRPGGGTPILTGTLLRMGTGRSPVLMRPNHSRVPRGFGDVNGDGYTDLFTSAKGGEAWIPGSPDGLASEARRLIPEPNGACDSHASPKAAFDWNGDGYDDLACLEWIQDTLYVYLGSASGPQSPLAVTRASLGLADYPFRDRRAVVADDVTGDGMDDLVVGWRSRLTVVSSTGSSGPRAVSDVRSPLDTSRGVIPALAAGDLDGDGYADVVRGVQSANKVTVYWGAADGLSPDRSSTIRPDRAGMPAVGAFPRSFGDSVAVGDLDADGTGDLVIGSPDDGTGGHVYAVFGAPDRTGPVDATAFGVDDAGIPGDSSHVNSFGNRVGVAQWGNGPADAVLGFSWLARATAGVTTSSGFGVMVPVTGRTAATSEAIALDPEELMPHRPHWQPGAPHYTSFYGLLG